MKSTILKTNFNIFCTKSCADRIIKRLVKRGISTHSWAKEGDRYLLLSITEEGEFIFFGEEEFIAHLYTWATGRESGAYILQALNGEEKSALIWEKAYKLFPSEGSNYTKKRCNYYSWKSAVLRKNC